jgi:ATP-dependent DNA helicase RecG
MPSYLERPIRYLRGMGPKRSEALLRLGVQSVEDLFYFFPRRHEDRSRFVPIHEIQPGNHATVKGEVLTMSLRRIKRMTIFEMAVGDDSGFLRATWFNQPYLKEQFQVGDTLILSGKVELYRGRLQMNAPDYESLSDSADDTIHSGRIVPIYPLTEGLGQRALRRALKELVDGYLEHVEEYMPRPVLERMNLHGLRDAIRNIHFPESLESYEKARERLIFDEFFLFEIAILSRLRRDRKLFTAYPLGGFEETLETYEKTLPFDLTAGQRAAAREIAQDLAGRVPMRRLLEGDVGSGKTVVAGFFLMLAARNGLQSVLMAPTEVLAEQHYETISRFLSSFGLKVAFLTGNVQGNERGEILADLRNHKISVAVGTHALIQEGIRFAKLGLVVIDEQHRFGVRQRAALLSGEVKPHLLVMTATPIPRTLGLTLYGDLEISTIDELPRGRKPVKTFWITRAREEEILRHVRDKASSGEQAYIIYPIIEETENLDLVAATQGYEKLKSGIFEALPVGLIHGRTAKWDRDRIMRDFRDGRIRVLVATSLVEVGIDNPNATLMVIEHAERFGLSQLHQLRGRIGRGEKESYCFLFGDPTTEEGKRRLRILAKTTDGFKIAEEDLRLRGPGDFLGTRQSGLPFFKIADLLRDVTLLKAARREAVALLKQHEGTGLPELLKQKVERATQIYDSD